MTLIVSLLLCIVKYTIKNSTDSVEIFRFAFMEDLHLIFDSNHFIYDGSVYKKAFSMLMSDQISVILIYLVVYRIFTEAFSDVHVHPLLVYTLSGRFVIKTILILYCNNAILVVWNHLKLTIQVEDNNKKLPFLNVLTINDGGRNMEISPHQINHFWLFIEFQFSRLITRTTLM